jgi:predicted dehydrogenase
MEEAASPKMIKWGFIGCGEVTEKKSGPAFNMIPGSKVVAVMSRDARKAESYAKRHKIEKWYTDPIDLIEDPDVNAIYVATPPSSHATFAILSMKMGKPVYVEKPLAANYEDCCRVNRISEQTGIPCFVAYYRKYLPYFQKVKELVKNGSVGNVINIQVRFAVPPRDLDYNAKNLPWRVQSDIAGGGYFYDLAPHQIDLLQDLFGPIVEAKGFSSNKGGLYESEDTVSACFRFMNGLPGSGSWCFVSYDSAKVDRIEIIGDKGQICFSVFTYEPIALHTDKGREEFVIPNPELVQLPLIKNVVEHLQKIGTCTCDSVHATSVNYVMDKILGKL